MTLDRFDAIVLAGALSRRLDGDDKALISIAGRTLLERAIDAVGDAAQIIVAGPRRPLDVDVVWVEESPSGAGPAHALATALRSVATEVVAVLACDHPLVDRKTIARLVVTVGRTDGAMVSDGSGRSQPLVAAYRTEALRARLEEIDSQNASVRNVTAALELEYILDDLAATDCDTREDLARAHALLSSKGRGAPG